MILSPGDSNTLWSASDSSMVPRFAPMCPPVTALLSIRNRRIFAARSSSSRKPAARTRSGVSFESSTDSASFSVIMMCVPQPSSCRFPRDDEYIPADAETGEPPVHLLPQRALVGARERQLELLPLRVARPPELIVADVVVAHQQKQVDRKRGFHRHHLEPLGEEPLDRLDVEVVHVVRWRHPPRLHPARVAQRRLKRTVVVRHHQRDQAAGIEQAMDEA